MRPNFSFAGSNGGLDAFRVGDIELSDEHPSRVRCLQVFQLCHARTKEQSGASHIPIRYY
jgi:hypothetical protein